MNIYIITYISVSNNSYDKYVVAETPIVAIEKFSNLDPDNKFISIRLISDSVLI